MNNKATKKYLPPLQYCRMRCCATKLLLQIIFGRVIDKAVLLRKSGISTTVYVFVATLPYSGYSYVEAFFSVNQECWTAAHVNAYRYFGGVTRMI